MLSDSKNIVCDVAVITAKAEEYGAFHQFLEDPVRWQGTKEHPNQYAWTLGKISTSTNKIIKVALGLTHEQTNVPAAIAILTTFTRFQPRYIIFMGIAGSLDPTVKKGDILIADYVRAYQYGRISESGAFEPYMQFQEPTDQTLRTNASAFSKTVKWWKRKGIEPRDNQELPNVYFGGLASGDSVIENIDISYFAEVVKKDNWLRAVDMESSGVALAIRHLKESGYITGFMILRGISDVPLGVEKGTPKRQNGSNRETRRQWTEHASNMAALFLHQFIKNSFPYSPEENAESRQISNSQTKQQLASDVFVAYQSHFIRSDELPVIHSINNDAYDQTVLVPPATLEAWWKANPLSIRLISTMRGEIVGYWQIICLTAEAFHDLNEGRLKESEICDADILTYQELNTGSVYIYITALAVYGEMQSKSSPVVLDLMNFLRLIDKTVGINGISAQSVSNGGLNLIVNFGMTNLNQSTWALNTPTEIDLATKTANQHLTRLKGMIPQSPQEEIYFITQILRRKVE